MDSKQLKDLIDTLLKPIGFKKKSNNWIKETSELIKVINLQKSNFGNAYYINVDYIIKGLKLNDLYAHVSDRSGSTDKAENKKIQELLNLDSSISDPERSFGFQKLFKEKIIPKIIQINTKKDLQTDLKNRQHLFNIPLIVKKYFKLVEQ